MPTLSMKRSSLVIMVLIFALAIALICNLFKISVVDNEKYQELANSNQFNSITISANRGSIYSSDGSVLAQSATVFKVFIDPNSFE